MECDVSKLVKIKLSIFRPLKLDLVVLSESVKLK